MQDGVGRERSRGAADPSTRMRPTRCEVKAGNRGRVTGTGGEGAQGEELIEALLAMMDVPLGDSQALLKIQGSEDFPVD